MHVKDLFDQILVVVFATLDELRVHRLQLVDYLVEALHLLRLRDGLIADLRRALLDHLQFHAALFAAQLCNLLRVAVERRLSDLQIHLGEDLVDVLLRLVGLVTTSELRDLGF